MIVVFGSLNADYVFSVKEIARPGETVLANDLEILAGGKGGNQALAAAKSGAQVSMFGAVGRDGNGDIALAGLRDASVELGGVSRIGQPTGMASIMVDRKGENSIAVFPGANALASAEHVPDAFLVPGNTLVMQMEVPAAEIADLAHRAARRGARTILNLAPAEPIAVDVLKAVDYLIVNQTEFAVTQTLLGFESSHPTDSALLRVSKALNAAIVVTLGADGVIATLGNQIQMQQALAVDAIDTVGAGDAFTGAFAAALDFGHSFELALQYGSVAGALACTKKGAQSALPSLEAIEAALKRFK